MTINGAWDLFHRGTQADLGVIQQIFVDDAYSLRSFERWPGLRRYADGSLSGRPLIVDCGANIGASSMYFPMAAYPQASVVALEPEAGNFQLLRENTAVFPGVKPLHNAVASKRSTLVISDPGIGEWGYRTGASGDGGRSIGSVEAIPIEDVMDVAGDAIPFDLLKSTSRGQRAICSPATPRRSRSSLSSSSSSTTGCFPASGRASLSYTGTFLKVGTSSTGARTSFLSHGPSAWTNLRDSHLPVSLIDRDAVRVTRALNPQHRPSSR